MKNESKQLDPGPFFHGTKAGLKVGDLLEPEFRSNHKDQPLKHIYFTATLDAAKWGAELAGGDGRERIYVVEPTGEYEDDSNLTDQRFPGNPTRSYRSLAPLKITAELGAWKRHSEEEISLMLENLARLKAEGKDVIIE